MLSGSFRRGGSTAFNVGKTLISRRMANEGRKSAAISVCLAHKMSTTAVSHGLMTHTDLATEVCTGLGLLASLEVLEGATSISELVEAALKECFVGYSTVGRIVLSKYQEVPSYKHHLLLDD